MPDLVVDIGGVCAGIAVPDELPAPFGDLPIGPSNDPGRDPDVRYRVTADGPERYGLERDRGGLRHNLDADRVRRALNEDLAAVVHRRRPAVVLARAGAVGIDGRAVIVLGPEGSGTSTLVSALLTAGARPLGDGLVALDGTGLVHPIVLNGSGPGAGDPPTPLPTALLVTTGFDPDAEWDPTEVEGTRAVLGLLDRIVPGQQRTQVARSLVGALAVHAHELRGLRPDAAVVAPDLVARARHLPVPDALRSAPTVAAPVSPTGAGPTTPARFVRFDDVLSADEHERVLEHTMARQGELAPSAVISTDSGDERAELRQSQTIVAADEIWSMFEERLQRLLPHVRRELDVAWFELGPIEHQLTVHGDGDHFTMHLDNSSPEVAARMVSAVYYFNHEPRRFSGGELRLFDTVERDGRIEATDTFTEVAPDDNTLVFFASDAPHEVRPVHTASGHFADRRFTMVFWARRAPTAAEVFTGDADTVADRQLELLPSLTADGFRAMDTPASVQTRLSQAFAAGSGSAHPEGADTAILLSGDPSFVELDGLREELLEELRGVHEDWYGAPLEPTSAFGLRVYHDGQTLARHADRVETHIISSIVHVAADIDEPWPLVVEDAGGERNEVVLEPGQMLLYEGAKLPHARPDPLRGRHYASLFLHYRPVDWPRTLDQVCRAARV